MNDLPTKDFLRWKGVKFCDQKNQNPGPEIKSTRAPKSGPTAKPEEPRKRAHN